MKISQAGNANKEWRNWAGNHHWTPGCFQKPQTKGEIVSIVQKARRNQQPLRVIGAGHSWTPLASTDGNLISLDDYQQILNVDYREQTVTVQAGIRLHRLNAKLAEYGLALSNLGSIDKQSLAGAISTGTHGTGLEHGILAKQVLKMELVSGTGELIYCSATKNPGIFYAALCGLGTLGVITTLTLQCEPAFRLYCIEEKLPLNSVLRNLNSLINENEHFKFYWLPFTNVCLTFTQNRTNKPIQRSKIRKWVDQYILRNAVYDIVCRLSSRYRRFTPAFNRLLTNFAASRVEYVDQSHEAFCFPIFVKHWESEHAIPINNTVQTIRELQRLFENSDFQPNMTMEFRFVDEDCIWLSPAYRRKSCFIDAIQYKNSSYVDYFKAVGELLEEQNGRPHWGKLHFKSADQLARLYPKWDQFHRIRRQLDPDGVFLNPYLRSLLGINNIES